MPAPNTTAAYGSLGIIFNFTAFTKQLSIQDAVSYSLTAGSLPDGVVVSSSGLLSGTPQIQPVSNQPIHVSVFRITATLSTGGTVNTIYTISVITNVLYVPDSVDLAASQPLASGYKYTLSFISPTTSTLYWRLKWGELPPSGFLTRDGVIEVGFSEPIQPFNRDSFVSANAPAISSLSQSSFDTWAKKYFATAQNLDYQFVVELAEDSGAVVAGHTVRIIHTRVPTSANTWFTENAAYITYDPNQYYYFIVSTINDNISWTVDSDLGTSINGSISEKQLTAKSLKPVTYSVMSRDYNRLPQGCAVLPSGMIAGRISFRCSQDDPINLPANDTYNFTVRASTPYDLCYTDKRFTWKVVRVNNKPSDNLYIRPFPILPEREAIRAILTDPSITNPDILYRNSDPWWNPGTELKFLFEVGLNHKQFIDYETAVSANHRKKSLLFDRLRVAYCIDDQLNTQYEVVYLTFIDRAMGKDYVTGAPVAQSASIDLRPYITNYYVKNNVSYYVFQPDALENMRSRISQFIGTTDRSSLLPSWMSSIQPSNIPGEFTGPLGLFPAVVLAYTKPGQSSKVLTALKNQKFNNFRFEFDRYIWESAASETYNFTSNTYTTGSTTEFDGNTTIFDQEATKFVSGLEYYSEPGANDKYVVFAKSGVFV